MNSLPQDMAAPKGLRGVDVFWIHPTTTRSQTEYNHDPLDPQVLKWTEESAVQRQGSAFSACCRILAPRYRAATTKALADPANREKAFALAYSDVERAFDWYMAHENRGRPFIISGHSQGGAHTTSLLEKRIKGTKLQRRMVAAYVIGINLMEGDLSPRLAGSVLQHTCADGVLRAVERGVGGQRQRPDAQVLPRHFRGAERWQGWRQAALREPGDVRCAPPAVAFRRGEGRRCR